MATEWEAAYSAGLVDGEGCISFVAPSREQQCRLSVQVMNTNHEVLRWLQGRWGGGIYAMRGNSRHPDWTLCYAWMLHGNEDRRVFLEAIAPYLIVKRRPAEIALKFIATSSGARPGRRHSPAVTARRWELFAEMRGLPPAEAPVVVNDDQLAMELVG